MARAVSYEVNGFKGMEHTLNGITSDPSVPWFLENLISVNGVLISRPGFSDSGRVSATLAGQGMGQFIISGAEKLVAIAGGEIYLYTAPTTWTLTVSAAVIAAASITFSTTARCYLTVLGTKLHISDGTNKPFMWDGTSAGGVTVLTNSPVLYGQPTIYYAKLCGIKNADRQSVVWCEENDLTTGYEAGGYLNVWTLTQTGGGTLYALKGTNEALYYWRASNIGAINGEVGPNFKTTGVHDAVSLERGSFATQTAVGYNGVWFYDEKYRPAVIKGGQVVNLWEQMAAGVQYLGTDTGQPYRPSQGGFTDLSTAAPAAGAAYGITIYPSLDAVIFWYTTFNGGLFGAVFNGSTNTLVSYFSVTSAAMGGASIKGVTTLESNGNIYMLTGDTARVGRLLDASDLGLQTAQSADAFGGATATNPPVRFVGARMGTAREMNQHFDTLSVEVEIESTAVSTIGIQYLTSQQQTISSMTTAQTATPTVDTKQKLVFGIAGYGRWIAPAITVNFAATTARDTVRFYGLTVDGFTDAADLSTS